MELRFLGRGAAFNAEQNNTAACIREGGHLLLLDCGETVFRELKVRGLLEGVREETAFDQSHVQQVDTLQDAWKIIPTLPGEELVVLLENDLPDNY